MDTPKVLAVTLARGGSTSIRNKNIADLGGIPLITHTIRSAKGSRLITDYVVSTDDARIKSVAEAEGAKVIDRPEYLATSQASSASALRHVLHFYPNHDIVVELMCTNPFKSAEDIDAAISMFLTADRATSVVSVRQVRDGHPARIKYINDYGFLSDFFPEPIESRRQDLEPEAFIRAGGIYVCRRDTLVNEFTRTGPLVLPYIIPDERCINIDEPIDLETARALLAYRQCKRAP